MKHFLLVCCLLLYGVHVVLQAQTEASIINNLSEADVSAGEIKYYWLKLIESGLGQAICVPVIYARGQEEGPTLGLTAAIHGNELNGIPIIQQLIADLDLAALHGSIIAIPGLNPISVELSQRRYKDDEDLNRLFPGKANGSESEQMVWQIKEKILPQFDYLIDMHTASFGRENALYVRADMSNPVLAALARVQDADIILESKGAPSTANASASARTMRAEAVLMGIPTLTIEYGNPQVYQPDMIARGLRGIRNALSELKLWHKPSIKVPEAVVCKKSYWIYTTQGGLLEVPVGLTEQVAAGTIIGILRNPFGEIIETYRAPEAGIIIGKSSNPVNQSGGRIVHLGILK